MKKLVSVIITALLAISSQAQFPKRSLQARGLTCAMCNNTVNKALQNVSFVESVQSDIKNSAKMVCVQTGKTAECCSKGGVPANARVYHVTI